MKSAGTLARLRLTALVEALGLYAVERGQVGVHDHPLAAHGGDAQRDRLVLPARAPVRENASRSDPLAA
jgi:hypothetical protein